MQREVADPRDIQVFPSPRRRTEHSPRAVVFSSFLARFRFNAPSFLAKGELPGAQFPRSIPLGRTYFTRFCLSGPDSESGWGREPAEPAITSKR